MPDPLTELRFAVCVANDGCDDLSLGMLYRVLPDATASAEGLLRVVDDSGEDYLYPSARFVEVVVPEAEVPRVLAVSSANVALMFLLTNPGRSRSPRTFHFPEPFSVPLANRPQGIGAPCVAEAWRNIMAVLRPLNVAWRAIGAKRLRVR